MPRDITGFEKLDTGKFYEKSTDLWYELIFVRREDYSSLEDAVKDGAEYPVANQLTWRETDGAISGMEAAVACLDPNNPIDIYARIVK